MQKEADGKDQKPSFQIFVGVLHVNKCVNDHHRLTDLDDQCGKSFGCYVINPSDLAAKIAHDKHQKHHDDDDKQRSKIVRHILVLQAIKLSLDLLHIRKHFLLAARVTQQSRRMVDRSHQKIAFFKPRAVLLGDFEIRFNQTHSGNSAKANDDFGIDQAHLLTQESDASILLRRKRITVFGRTAFENICNVNVLAVNVNCIQIFIKKLAGSADKGRAGKILLLTGSLAYKQNIRFAISRAKYTIRTCCGKLTASAAAARLIKLIPSQW
jgi:hypothetical protein